MSRFTSSETDNSVIHLLNGDFSFPTSLTIGEVINTNQHKWEPAEPMLAYLTENNEEGIREKIPGPTRFLIKPPTYGTQEEYTYGVATGFVGNALENCLTDTVLYPRFGGVNGLEDKIHRARLYNWSTADLQKISKSLPVGSVFNVAMWPDYLSGSVDISGMGTTTNAAEGFIGEGNVPLLSMIKDGYGNYVPLLSNENCTKWFVGSLPTESINSSKWEQLNAVNFREPAGVGEAIRDCRVGNPNAYPIVYVDYAKRTGSSLSGSSFKCDDFRVGKVMYDEDTQRLAQISPNGGVAPYLTRNDTVFYDMVISPTYNQSTNLMTVTVSNNPIEGGGIDAYYTVNLVSVQSNVLVIDATPDPGRIYYLLVLNNTSSIVNISLNTSNIQLTIGAPETALELNPSYAIEFSFYGKTNDASTGIALVTTHSEELKINTQSL